LTWRRGRRNGRNGRKFDERRKGNREKNVEEGKEEKRDGWKKELKDGFKECKREWNGLKKGENEQER
jgi:hypothetical protein